jgi:TRAP-type C4-dicarboxylate transport system permease small subunit
MSEGEDVQAGERPAKVGRIATAATLSLGIITAFCLLSMMSITTADVLGRYLFASPLPGAFEITQILLAATIFAGLPIVTLKQEHVTVTIASDRLPPPLRRIHAAMAGLIGAGVLAVVAWRLADQAARLSSYGDTTSLLRIPLSPLAWMMAGLTALAAVAAAALAWRALAGAQAPAPTFPPQAG